MRPTPAPRATSITRSGAERLYHEILEAATVASLHPPVRVMEFNEGDFERAARAAHAEWGDPTPENPNRMLQSYGFREE